MLIMILSVLSLLLLFYSQVQAWSDLAPTAVSVERAVPPCLRLHRGQPPPVTPPDELPIEHDDMTRIEDLIAQLADFVTVPASDNSLVFDSFAPLNNIDSSCRVWILFMKLLCRTRSHWSWSRRIWMEIASGGDHGIFSAESSIQEALIQRLLRHYEQRLREQLSEGPQTLEEIEREVGEIGKQVQKDMLDEKLAQRGTGYTQDWIACACGRKAAYTAEYRRHLLT